ncbi:AOX1 [Branchiostoma lanceolatum]|uniref:AOX1 protein n=1 Tax=Branchiostoma lanceolatum TaxID=7740 RepID=A0A8J9ZRY4_BRALA|nr:AOX1 [Branchiostoma lanceolatum]
MVSRYNPTQRKVLHLAVNACLAPICSLHGAAVTTVEGIGSTRTRLHPVQERLAKAHGSQCGFCTPGIVMSMYTLLRNHPTPDMEQLEAAFQGNLCRCTGYRPILEGYKTFTKEFQGCCGGMAGNGCCRNGQNGQAANGQAANGQASNGHAANGQAANGQTSNGHAVNGQATNGQTSNGHAVNGQATNGDTGNGWNEDVSKELFQVSEFQPLDPTQEPIFPPELMKTESSELTTLKFAGERVTWIKPATFKEVLELKAKNPRAKLVIGNSEIGVEVKFKNCEYPLIIAPGHLPEINFHRYTEHGITFGAGCTLTYLNDTLAEAIHDLPEHQTRLFAAIVEMLRWFAGHQIRNVGCIGGNIVTASPISDLNPIFLSAGCTVTVMSHQGGSRVVKMDHAFFPGYRKTALTPEEVMVSLDVPFTKEVFVIVLLQSKPTPINMATGDSRDQEGLYAKLSVTPTATREEIVDSYQKEVLLYHEQAAKLNRKDPARKEAEYRYREVSDAFTILSDLSYRQQYDDSQVVPDLPTFTRKALKNPKNYCVKHNKQSITVFLPNNLAKVWLEKCEEHHGTQATNGGHCAQVGGQSNYFDLRPTCF